MTSYVMPTVGALGVREISTPAIDRTLKAVSSPAGRALKLALRDRVAPGQPDITGETRELDLPDVVDFMLSTGVRIDEALSVRAGGTPTATR